MYVLSVLLLFVVSFEVEVDVKVLIQIIHSKVRHNLLLDVQSDFILETGKVSQLLDFVEELLTTGRRADNLQLLNLIVGVLLHVEVHWGVAELAKVRDVVFDVQSEAGQVLCVAVLLKFD